MAVDYDTCALDGGTFSLSKSRTAHACVPSSKTGGRVNAPAAIVAWVTFKSIPLTISSTDLLALVFNCSVMVVSHCARRLQYSNNQPSSTDRLGFPMPISLAALILSTRRLGTTPRDESTLTLLWA